MKLTLYIETSVPCAYLDNDEPFRRDLTIRWWEHEMAEYTVYSSQLVTRELERMTEPHRTGYLKLVEPFGFTGETVTGAYQVTAAQVCKA